MNEKHRTRISRFLSLVLRHDPEKINLILDASGWTDVTHLLCQMQQAGKPVTREQLATIVATNNKKRFAFSPDGTQIRANQGHSINIDLGLKPITPPDTLYHGTATQFLASILQKGLIAGSRQHVHLSSDIDTAHAVGSRHGKPIILTVKAQQMYQNEHSFYQSENKVWLTNSVPISYIENQP